MVPSLSKQVQGPRSEDKERSSNSDPALAVGRVKKPEAPVKGGRSGMFFIIRLDRDSEGIVQAV